MISLRIGPLFELPNIFSGSVVGSVISYGYLSLGKLDRILSLFCSRRAVLYRFLSSFGEVMITLMDYTAQCIHRNTGHAPQQQSSSIGNG